VESVLLLIAALLLLDALVGEKGVVAMMRARDETRGLERELRQSWAQGKQLRERIRQLNDDPATIEDLARRKLRLIMPGEMVFTIKEAKPDEP
jgi:cell division protein FtsB